MQNKGFVKLIALALTVICCFYLIFTVKSRNFKSEVDDITAAKKVEFAKNPETQNVADSLVVCVYLVN